MLYLKPLASYWSPTALKRPDRSKQCHCLQFAECIASLLFTQIYDYDVTNENKHARREINEQTSHGCKFCSVGTELPKLIQKLSECASSAKME